jgi:hypothetical protein
MRGEKLKRKELGGHSCIWTYPFPLLSVIVSLSFHIRTRIASIHFSFKTSWVDQTLAVYQQVG